MGLFDISRAANINRASSYINRVDATIVDRKSARIANIIKTADKPDWKSYFDFVTKQQWNLIDKTSWEKELIEPSDYRSIKADYEKEITCLALKLIELSKESNNIEPLLNKAVASLSSLDKLYENASNETKREIIGSVYPEKPTFDGFHYRTARLNKAVELIYSLGKGFSENENGQTEVNFDLSTLVTWIGFEPMTLSLEG